MRVSCRYAEYELMSVISAVRKDSESWTNWHCLRIESPSAPLLAEQRENVRELLENHVSTKRSTAFFCASGELVIFCKQISPEELRELGNIIQQAMGQQDNPLNMVIYDVAREWNVLTEIYTYDKLIGRKERSDADSLIAPSVYPDKMTTENLNNRRVLLIEDDPVTRWLVRSALKGECVLSTADGAHAAMAMYQSFKPDVILLDLHLPDGDGYGVMDRILICDPHAYIVIFSSHDSMDNIVSVMDRGARGFVAKPFTKEQLLHHVHAQQ